MKLASGLLLLAGACGPPSEQGTLMAEALVTAAPVVSEQLELARALRDEQLSVDGPAPGSGFRVIGSADALERLERRGLRVRLLRPDHRRPPAPLPAYHDPEELNEALAALAATWPERSELVELGQSVEGRPLWALRIGQGDWRVRVLAAHHGDELVAGEAALALAEQLLEQEPELSAEVWIVPQVNPDGVARGSRYNARDVDLNRNYGFQWSDAEFRSGDEAFSEPETRAVRVLSGYRPFASGLSLHAGAELLCYVWNWTTVDSLDESLLLDLGEAYRERCSLPGFSVVNGAAWYFTQGDSTDWSYGRRGTLDYTLELSLDKSPSADELQVVIEHHMDAMVAFLEQAPAVLGTVRAAADGRALEAWISPVDGWPSVSGPDGSFARWFEPGTLTLQASLPGYAAQEQQIELVAGETTRVEFLLEVDAQIQVRPTPGIVPWGSEPRELELPGISEGPVSLWRPGYESFLLEGSDEVFSITPSDLAPGPWGVATPQGAMPRALFIGERSDRVSVQEVTIKGDAVLVGGQGFGQGSRAWALGWPGRTMLAVPVLGEHSQQLQLDASFLEELEDPVDLLLVSAGAQLAVLDLREQALVDTAAPADTQPPWLDSGGAESGTDDSERGRGGCGCAGAGERGLAPAVFLVTLASALLTAGRRRNLERRSLSDAQ